MARRDLYQHLKEAAPLLSIGVLTADWMDLGAAVRLLEQAGVKLLHIDVMDGNIWPKITVGSGFVEGLHTRLYKDVHLLIDQPEKHLESFIKAGANILTFSAEYCHNVPDTLGAAANLPGRADVLIGVSLDPQTPLDTVAAYGERLDVLTLLAVGPDTGKANFIADLPARIDQARQLCPNALLMIDGAIKKDNIAQVAAMGPEVIVTGSAVFDGKDPAGNLNFMLKTLAQG